jgi:hypothetical protein
LTQMINCMRFRPIEGQVDNMFKAMAEYIRDFPFDDIMHAVIDLGDGEFALIGIHHSVDSFVDIMNRDNRVSDLMRKYVVPYEDGESFSFIFWAQGGFELLSIRKCPMTTKVPSLIECYFLSKIRIVGSPLVTIFRVLP